MRNFATLYFATLLLFATQVSAVDGYQASYKLVVGNLSVGKMDRSFVVAAGGAYRFTSTFQTTGLAAMLRKEKVTESSSGTFRDGVFSPEQYTYTRKRKKKPKHITMQFDRTGNRIDTVTNNQQQSSSLSAGVLDKLIYQAALMHDLELGKLQFHYVIADRGKEKIYEPVAEGNVSIETELGIFETIKLTWQSKGDSKSTTFWCAAEFGYLPVRVLHRDEDGSETIASIVTYQKHDVDNGMGN
jgi:hypothetical protein